MVINMEKLKINEHEKIVLLTGHASIPDRKIVRVIEKCRRHRRGRN